MSVKPMPAPGSDSRLPGDFFERLFEGAGLAIFACDPSGIALAWNSLGQEMLSERGLAREGVNLRELLPDAARLQFEECLKSLLRNHTPLEFRATLARADGIREYAVWLAPLDRAASERAGVSVWFHDITDRVQHRKTLRKSERLNSLGAMSGSVSHHYANILGSIAMSLGFAEKMNTVTAMRRALQRTGEAVATATELTRQLQAFAQADTRRSDQADLTEMILQFVDENETAYQQRGVRTNLEWEPIPIIPLPRDQFTIVLRNLATNAIEAMPGGGELTVAIQNVDAQYVRIAMRDTGEGIRPHDMERLFEPFFTTKGELGEGERKAAGMGLAVAHGLIREMNGVITAHNDPAGGARFEITLPISQPEMDRFPPAK